MSHESPGTDSAAPPGQTNSPTTPLAYAGTKTPSANAPPRFDVVVLALAGIQGGLAFLACVPAVLLRRGYSETDASAWLTRAAWRLTDTDPYIILWFVTWALIAIGATRPPGRRRIWYAGAIVLLAMPMILWWSILAILEDTRFSHRWVSTYYGTPEPQSWNSFVPFDSTAYWQWPVMLTIANSVCILLIVRWFRFAIRSRTD